MIAKNPGMNLTLPKLRKAAEAALLGLSVLALSSCGGSGGGQAAADPPSFVQVTVVDGFGAPVSGAVVQGPLGTTSTSTQGVTLVLTSAPGATASVVVSRDTFVDRSTTVTSAPGQVAEVRITLDRQTRAAGGSLTTRSASTPSVDPNAQTMSFEIEVVVVGSDSQPITTLTGADFKLLACTPDPADPRFDCVRGDVASDDAPYAPVSAGPESVVLVPGSNPQPYATALLLDQSSSMQQSDPTAGRLYASKAFVGGLAPDDQVLLAAFAGGSTATIPTPPLTVYGPFRTQTQAPNYFATLDSLVPLLGGDTPLYESVDSLRQQWLAGGLRSDGLGKGLVVFTDGGDNLCKTDTQACRTRRLQSITDARAGQVRIFSIALSRGVDVASLGELAQQTGGALLYADNVAQLLPLYGSLGRLMSLSLPTYRLRWTVQAGTPGSLRSGFSLLGRVQVTTAGNTFEVPFIVGIP
jgi:hypothetical protein